MKKLFATLITIGFCINAISQETRIWTDDFGANLSNYYSNHPKIESNGDTIIVSGVKNSASGQRFLIVKYNMTGDTISTLEFGKDSVSNSRLIDYKYGTDKSLYLLQQDYLEFYKSKIVIQKYTNNGDLIWVQQIQNFADTSYTPNSLAIVNDTCIFVNGYKEYDYPEEGDDVIMTTSIPLIYAFNIEGDSLWEKQFNPATEIDYFMHKMISYNNKALLFGNNSSTYYCLLEIGLDKSVNVTNDLEIENGINHVLFTSDNKMLITSGTKYRITKLGFDGKQIWTSYYGTFLPSNVSGDEIKSIIQQENGNIIVTGRHYGDEYNTENYTNADILTLKYDKEGNLIWENRFEYNGDNADIGNSLCLKNGFVYIGGQSQRLGKGTDYDYVVLKLDTVNGTNEGTYRFNNTSDGDDAVSSICVFDDGKVALTGLSKSNSSFNWTTQLLSDVITSINQISKKSEILIYPNPVEQNGFINVLNSGFDSYTIADMNGRIVSSGLLNESTENKISTINFKKGIYFLTLKNELNAITNKLIVK